MKTTSTIRNLITRKIAELGIQTQIENESDTTQPSIYRS
jgi:hypothetical protein